MAETQRSAKPTVSILVPMYNEAEVLPKFFTRLREVLDRLDVDHEIVCVDDGSRDATLALLLAEAERDPRVKVIAFSRNFGKEAAMSAAIDFARGDAGIPIDADLQDPPELIEQMIAKWREGYDVVFAKRASRASDTLLKRKTAEWFYAVFNRMSEIDIPRNVGDFRLMDRRVLDVIRRLPERVRFMKGLFCWPGFKSTVIEFERPQRAEGHSKFNYWKLWNFALSGITSFSTLPIRLGVYVGLGVAAIAFVYGLFIIAKTLLWGVDTPGYASLMVVMLFLGGVQLFFLGLLGEYIGRIYQEVKQRPLYVVDRTYNVDA